MTSKVKKPDEKQSFEKSLEAALAVISDLENSQVPLADLLDKYALAKGHLENCRKLLEDANIKISQLNKNGLEKVDL